MTALSILDLVRVTQDTDARGALETPVISRSTPRRGAIAAFGWRSITTCLASRAPRRPS